VITFSNLSTNRVMTDNSMDVARSRVLARLQQRHGQKERACERDRIPIDAAGVAGRDPAAVEFDSVFNPLIALFNDTLTQFDSADSDKSDSGEGTE
jgi:hypothetical protein